MYISASASPHLHRTSATSFTLGFISWLMDVVEYPVEVEVEAEADQLQIVMTFLRDLTPKYKVSPIKNNYKCSRSDIPNVSWYRVKGPFLSLFNILTSHSVVIFKIARNILQLSLFCIQSLYSPHDSIKTCPAFFCHIAKTTTRLTSSVVYIRATTVCQNAMHVCLYDLVIYKHFSVPACFHCTPIKSVSLGLTIAWVWSMYFHWQVNYSIVLNSL